MNKRDFLKLACAAPVIGPVIARHIASPRSVYATGGYLVPAEYRASVFEMITPCPNEVVALRLPGGVPRIAGDCFTECRDGLFSCSVELKGASEVPNRLAGAFIKEDGDAA